MDFTGIDMDKHIKVECIRLYDLDKYSHRNAIFTIHRFKSSENDGILEISSISWNIILKLEAQFLVTFHGRKWYIVNQLSMADYFKLTKKNKLDSKK